MDIWIDNFTFFLIPELAQNWPKINSFWHFIRPTADEANCFFFHVRLFVVAAIWAIKKEGSSTQQLNNVRCTQLHSCCRPMAQLACRTALIGAVHLLRQPSLPMAEKKMLEEKIFWGWRNKWNYKISIQRHLGILFLFFRKNPGKVPIILI